MKDLDFSEKDVPTTKLDQYNTISIDKTSPSPFKSRYKHEMFFDKQNQTLKKPKYVGGFDYNKSLQEIQ